MEKSDRALPRLALRAQCARPVALAATRLMRSQLYGLPTNDPLTLALVTVILALRTG